MCHLLNSVITLADLDVTIKELHQFVLVSLWFIAWAKGTKQEAGELQRGDVLPSIPEPFCLARELFPLGCDTASASAPHCHPEPHL